MTFAGLPLHFLVIHVAVVFTPLAALLVAAFAVVPRWRWLLRWPAAVVALVALAAVWTAKLSGDSYLHSRPQLAPLVQEHMHRGNVLLYLMIGFFVLTLIGVWALGGPSALASGRGGRASQVVVLDMVLPVLLVAAAVVVVIWVVLTGDAGARAVWG
jgi:hypothetical protein